MPADEQSGCFPRSEKTEIGKYRFFLRYERRDAAGAAELLSVILCSEESVSIMKEEGNPGGFSRLQYDKNFPVKGSFS